MNLLALDTSSLACSVALQVGSQISDRHEEQPREHTRLLVPMISSLLAELRIKLVDVDAIVLGNGPGSFIGMRIAASVAQGLAFGSRLKIVPVSSLAAVAAQVMAECDAKEVVVAQDAHMHEVYLGLYRHGGNGSPELIGEESLHGQSPIDEIKAEPGFSRIAAGFGWQRYPDLLAINREKFTDVADVLHPRAKFLLRMGAVELKAGRGVAPENVLPAYLRQKVAELPSGP